MKTRKSFVKMWVRAAALCILVLGTVTSLTPPPAAASGGKSGPVGPGLKTVPATVILEDSKVLFDSNLFQVYT